MLEARAARYSGFDFFHGLNASIDASHTAANTLATPSACALSAASTIDLASAPTRTNMPRSSASPRAPSRTSDRRNASDLVYGTSTVPIGTSCVGAAVSAVLAVL